MVPHLKVAINGKPIKAYIDTGASITLIAHTEVPQLLPMLKPYKGRVLDANGNKIPIIGEDEIYIDTPDGILRTRVLVFDKPPAVEYTLLLGMDVLKNCILNFEKGNIQFPKEKVFNHEDIAQDALRITVQDRTIYNKEKNERAWNSTRTIQLKEIEPTSSITDKPVSNGSATVIPSNAASATSAANAASATNAADAASVGTVCTTTANQLSNNARPSTGVDEATVNVYKAERRAVVHLGQDITLPPRAVTLATIKINKQLKNGCDIALDKTQVTPTVCVASVVTSITNQTIQVNMLNLSENMVTLTKGTKICTASYLNYNNDVTASKHCVNTVIVKAKPDCIKPLTEADIKCDDPAMTSRLLPLLNEYREASWLPGEPLGKYTGDQLEIKLKDNVIVNKAPYRVPYCYQSQLDKTIQSMLNEGTIQLSKSSYNSPLIIVKRPDGDIRPCIDYRELNAHIEPVNFPLPKISDLMNSLGQAVYMSTIDLASAYHQCEIKPEDRHKTAFTVKNSKFEFTRIPFGIQSAPGFFARIMNEILYEILGPECLCYMDDIVIMSSSVEQHFKTLEAVLRKLADAGIKIKLKKCHFFATDIHFLGYKVTKDGMSMNEDKVKAIHNMPMPSNKKEVQSFLGFINYYRTFIPNFAQIAEPLYDLLRKNTKFEWSETHSAAINTLKTKIANAPIVKFPDYSKAFHLHTDASNTGIGAVLMQETNGILHPIAYVSKTLNKAQRNYATTKREALALVYALEQFRHIILQFEVHVYTDHLPLLGALKKPTRDECLQRWSLLVQEYAIQLHYLPGKNNLFADTMSRLPAASDLLSHSDTEQLHQELNDRNELCNVNILNEYIPEKVPWNETKLRNEQRRDASCKQLYRQFTGKKDDNGKLVPDKMLLNCRVINGIIYILRRIKRSSLSDEFLVPYIPDTLMPSAFKLMHSDSTAGHSGPDRTLKLFIRNFYNRNERDLITKYCSECELCVRAKQSPKAVPIAKYPVPQQPFETISSDLLGPLRVTEAGSQYIMTVRDHTTRYTLLFPLTAKTTNNIINALRQVIANYGPSKRLITDNAPEYKSETLKAFLSYYNTEKIEVSPYHPASNGLAEVINRSINRLLRIYTNQYATADWDLLLPVIQHTINNTYNRMIRETPFFALFGYDSAAVTLSQPKLSYSEDRLTQHMSRVAAVRQHCRENLLAAQSAYTSYTNEGRQEKTIRVGQRVFAKVIKHRQGLHRKLDLPVSGPFKVIGLQGRSFRLKELATNQLFTVHPDYIIVRTRGVQCTECHFNVGSLCFRSLYRLSMKHNGKSNRIIIRQNN